MDVRKENGKETDCYIFMNIFFFICDIMAGNEESEGRLVGNGKGKLPYSDTI